MQTQETAPQPQGFSPESLPNAEVKTFSLRPEDTVYMANGLQPMREEKLVFGGEEKAVDVVASITDKYGGPEPVEILLTKEAATPDSPVQANLIRREGEKTIVEKTKQIQEEDGRSTSLRLGDRKIARIKPDGSDYRGWPGIRSDSHAELTISEASQPIEKTLRSRQSSENLKRGVKKVLAVGLGILAIKGPGGIVDRVADTQNNAAEYVSTEIPDVNENRFNDSIKEEIAEIPEDGVVWDGVDLNKEEATEWVKVDIEKMAPHYNAVDRVTRTMGDMDDHNEAEITARANEFKERLGDEIMSEEQTQEILDTVNSAETVDELKDEMTKFMGRFDSKFVLAEGEKIPNLESVRYMSQQIVESLSYLPSSLVKQSIGGGEFEVNFKPRDPSEQSGTSVELGSYGPDKLTINGRTLTTKIIPELWFTRDSTTKQTILHEVAHGLGINDTLGQLAEEGEKEAGYGKIDVLKSLGSHALGHPEKTTLYAAYGGKIEEVAESAADVLKGDMASPDHYLSFTSGANSSRLKVLIALESLPDPEDYFSDPSEYYRGITDYLVAKFKLQSIK